MKLTDIDKTLNEAPAGLLKRAATKLKKHTPFAPGVRAQAEGQDEVEAAANAVALAFRKWLGRNSRIKDKKNSIPATELVKFFNAIKMGKTGEEIIAAKAKEKKTNESLEEKFHRIFEAPVGEPETVDWEQPGFDKVAQDAEDEAKQLGAEQEEDAPVLFSLGEVEELILDVVGEIQSENPDGLDDWLRAKGVKQEQPTVADQAETISDEDFEIVRQEIDELVDKIADVSIGEVDTARAKKALRQKIEQLKDQSLNQLTR